MLNRQDLRELFAAQQILEREKFNVFAKELAQIIDETECKPEHEKALAERLFHDGWLQPIADGLLSKEKKYIFAITKEEHGEFTLQLFEKDEPNGVPNDSILDLQYYLDTDDAATDVQTICGEGYEIEEL